MSRKFNREEINVLAVSMENQKAEEVAEWALKTFHPKIALASSFGAEDMVLIDILWRINPQVRVFTLDTGRLPQETYNLMEEVRGRYKLRLEIYFPDTSAVERMVSEHGVNLFYKSVENRRLCCHVRKVEPLKRALRGLDAWITGLRREQGLTRKGIKKVEIDEVNDGIVKVNPLADWTSEDVWSYIREKGLPYNPLHDKGYISIGCAPCTRPVKPGEDFRAGRWWWERGTGRECGLHSPSP